MEWLFDSGLIALVGGTYAVLLAYGIVPAVRKSEANRQYFERVGPFLKIFGAIAAVGGLVRFVLFLW